MRCASGMRASAAGSTLTVVHQHGVAKSPLHAGAHAFGPPHSGQIWFGCGIMSEMMCSCFHQGIQQWQCRVGDAIQALLAQCGKINFNTAG